ncbi:MAG TPA: TIGR01212 family radical SAM protein [Candidatus Faecalicoccus intestinipullorum]|nr:TIGR01212 family radical SAM protein [Candidatus Faecalicoccus intestinipullorum]
MNNPYRNSNDNKRYQTMNYYFRSKYGTKVAKVPLNAGFTCPNRDGTKGILGCTFCSEKGSGDSILKFDQDLQTQYEKGLARMQKKWPRCLGFAYFQSYTNTYADLDTIKKIYDPFYARKDVTGICIATRADCLAQDVLDYFAEKAKEKETWLEIGLQSIHNKTIRFLNRCHTTEEVWEALDRIKTTEIKSCIHIINSLPSETKEDMIETVKELSCHPFDAIKIHMLHLIQNTQMAEQYRECPFPLLSLEEYVDVVVKQLEYLPYDCVVERLTGDGMAKDLIEPKWTIKKTIVTNEIDKKMVQENTWQGKKSRISY